MTNVVSIQYPSGGFGHFTHVILSVYGKGFSGNITDYNFGPGGDSHAYPVDLPKYLQAESYSQDFYNSQLSQVTSQYSTVLIDSGIDNDSSNFRKFITPDISIRICYNDWSWPMLAQMFYTRCMAAVKGSQQEISQWIRPDQGKWDNLTEPWVIREKFFLYLRDHSFRHTWRPGDVTLNISVDRFLSYTTLYDSLTNCFEVSNFESFYNNWYQKNHKHFKSYLDAQYVIKNLHNNVDISHINDLWTQAVVYYYIWLQYNVEVPHNDYSDWFTSTDDIVTMLKNQGVIIDPI